MTGTYIQTAAALIFVVLLIVGAGYFFKRKQNRYGLMSIVGYQPFGAKKGVAALKVGKDVMVIGVTQNEMRLLKIYGEEELGIVKNEGFQGKLEMYKRMGNEGR